MGWRPDTSKAQRGATIVEYAILMSLVALGMIPAVGLATEAVGNAHENTASHFSTTVHSYNNPSGGGGGGESSTTTTLPPTTTTTLPPTTTTTLPPTTTTTLPPTTTTTLPPTTTTTLPPTTTTTLPPNQIETADYGGEIVVIFTETDGVVGYEIVEAEGWTVSILSETDDKVRLRFTRQDPYLRVIAKGWLLDDPGEEDNGALEAKTRELDD